MTSRRTRLTIRLAGALSLPAIAATGCTHHDATPSGSTPASTTAQETSVANPETVIKDLDTQVRKLVDDAATWFPSRANELVDHGEDACQLPSDTRFPTRSFYGRRLQVSPAQAIPAAQKVAGRFAADGWDKRVDPSSTETALITLQKDGFIMQVNAATKAVGTDIGVVTITGDTPCVEADGSVDRSAVP